MGTVVEGMKFLVTTYPGIEYYILAGTAALMCVGVVAAGIVKDRH